jgi:hypothetical protein
MIDENCPFTIACKQAGRKFENVNEALGNMLYGNPSPSQNNSINYKKEYERLLKVLKKLKQQNAFKHTRTI